jgi:hypothetical protein
LCVRDSDEEMCRCKYQVPVYERDAYVCKGVGERDLCMRVCESDKDVYVCSRVFSACVCVFLLHSYALDLATRASLFICNGVCECVCAYLETYCVCVCVRVCACVCE